MISQNKSLLDRINQLIESGSFELPVFNNLALNIQQLGSEEELDVQKMEQMIASDQAVAAEVLRIANSPFYGGLATINTIKNAIVRLGVRQVRRLILLASQRAQYRARDQELAAILRLLWNHASMTAMGAQWIATRIHAKAIGEVCFIGGLLHDIGQLVILRAIDELKQNAETNPISPSLVKEVLIAAHCQLGCSLLSHWNIP
jgi:HD-like signal output (HDOD) protein